MDAELKTKWVEALRSGKYTQARRTLRGATEGFCCLGVLCDVYDPTQWEFHKHDIDPFWGYKKFEPKIYANIENLFGEGNNIGKNSKLIDMNDNFSYSFSEIADWVEKNI